MELQATDIHGYLATACYIELLKALRSYILSTKEGIKHHHILEVQKLLSGKKDNEKITYDLAQKILTEFVEEGVAITINKKEFGWVRDNFKSVVYGLIYGATAKRISEVLNLTKNQGEIVLRIMNRELPTTFKYLDGVAKTAVKDGYVILSERTKARRWFSDVLDSKANGIELSFGLKGNVEREAKNAPIQATNAFIIKEAIVRIENEYIRPNNIDARLLMTVHDELVYKFPESMLEEFPAEISRILTNTAESYLMDGISMGNAMHVADTWYK